jgi:hypothetical protein
MAETPRFDPLYPEHLTGHIHSIEVFDQDNTPNYILELDRPWKVTIRWGLTSNAPATDPVDVLAGTWNVNLIVESMGIGPERTISTEDVALGDAIFVSAARCEWEHTFELPVNTIRTEAVYKLITLITYRNASGHRRAMAGFQEGPLVNFFRDVG